MSDTPLTDKAAIGFARILVDRETHECVEIIPSDFARTLECQLAEAQAEIEADNRNAQGFLDQIHKMSQEIERMREEIRRYQLDR